MKQGAFNLLSLRAILPDSDIGLSVKDTARQLITFMDKLSDIDPMFSSFTPLKRKNTLIDIKALGVDDAIDALSTYFLESNNWRNDLPTWDIRENPDENSSQSVGFRFVFGFKDKGESRLSITGNISNDTKHFPRVLFLQYFNQETEHTYPISWYESCLKAVVQYWQPQEASVGSSAWTQMKVKTGLGRISYFANDYAKFDVLDDLTDVEYIKADNGRYLYICPSFTPELETFKAEEAQIVSVMEELRTRVPEYSK